MEPLALNAVAGWLADYAAQVAGGVVDSAVADGVRRLWDAVAARFGGDPVAEGALDRLREQPENTRRQGAVEDHLEELVRSDPEFARTLAELVRALGEESAAEGSTHVHGSGAVAAGQGRVSISGTYAGGRDVHVHGVTPPAENG